MKPILLLLGVPLALIAPPAAAQGSGDRDHACARSLQAAAGEIGR